MLSLPEALRPLTAYRQFIVCQFVPDLQRPGKTHKYPMSVHTGRRHDAHDPTIWLSADEAIICAARFGDGYGVGFVFTADDPFFFIDVDECITSAGYSPIVAELAALFPGVAMEISHSGRGLHLIGVGRAPEERRIKDKTGKLFDLFTELRFVALTGTAIVGHAGQYDYSQSLAVLAQRHLQREVGEVTHWTDGPCEEWSGPADDAELIRRALRSQSVAGAFGTKATFADLWNADHDALAKFFPHPGAEPFDASSADSALAQHLAFWTGKDCERIQRLMGESKLVREKWNRDDYLPRTIQAVVSIQKSVLTDKHPEPAAGMAPADGDAPRPTQVTGSTYLGIEDQINLFAGCVYVTDQHKIMLPTGHLLEQGQFRVAFGGYSFSMDGENKRTSRNAWEAFTENREFRAPRVDSTSFHPEMKPGAIFQNGGYTLVNNYVPVDSPRQVGDAGPFLEHLRKLLPDERDQTILLSYMAAMVQHKGHKFQWAPFLQGVEGNGKSFFSRCLTYAVGERYSHWPRADQISKKFNSWQLNKIFIAVEDIYIPEAQRSVWEIMKPMITGDRQDLEPKGVDSSTRHVCCNYLLNSNKQDAIPKTQMDRRAAPLFTAQQAVSDLARDGMNGGYMQRLKNWADRGGFAIVSELLHTYPIPPEFDPSGACDRAPNTSSTQGAIGESLGFVEQEILEAVAQEQVGFAGGWISSTALDALIARKAPNFRLPANQRRNMMKNIGYDWHPGLADGRVNNVVQPDNTKPRLYVKAGHAAQYIHGAAAIAKAYTDAQVAVTFPS